MSLSRHQRTNEHNSLIVGFFLFVFLKLNWINLDLKSIKPPIQSRNDTRVGFTVPEIDSTANMLLRQNALLLKSMPFRFKENINTGSHRSYCILAVKHL